MLTSAAKGLPLLDNDRPASERPQGALALVSAWRDVQDDELRSVIEDIYTTRENDPARPVALES